MLDLQTRVDLEKVKLLVLRVVHELDRSRGAVADRPPEACGGRQQTSAQFRGDPRSRSLLDHLLVAALNGTVTFAERDDAASTVAEDLHLDVACLLDIALEEHPAAAEVLARQPLHLVQRRLQIRLAADELHADASAARRTFEHDGVADAARFARGRGGVGKQIAARQQRHAGA